jgi:hypothetical protein
MGSLEEWPGSDEKHPNIHPVFSDFSDGLRLPT